MDLPDGVKIKSFRTHVTKIFETSNGEVRAEHLASAEEVHSLHATGMLFVPPQIVVDSSDSEGGLASNNEDEDHSSSDESCRSDDNQSECGSGSLDPLDSLGDSNESMTPDSDHSNEGANSDDSDGDEGDGVEGDGNVEAILVDVTVTFDGTWSKRGYTALNGVMVVIPWDTGRVLSSVGTVKSVLGREHLFSDDDDVVDSSLEFQQWFELHEVVCSLNHSGTAGSMEVEGALVLWKRSVERLNLRYVNVVSDGDSKVIIAVQNAKLYGDGVKIVKFECVGHVQKHVGASIINLRKKPPIRPATGIIQKARKGRKTTKNRPAVAAQPEITKVVMKKSNNWWR